MESKYQQEHKKYENSMKKGLIFVVIGMLLIAPLAFFLGPIIGIFAFVFVLYGVCILVVSSSKMHANLNAFKKEYVIERMYDFFEELNYDFNSGIRVELARELNLFDTGDDVCTHEQVSGKYRGCSFLMGNVECKEERTVERFDKEVTEHVTIFDGRIIILGLNIINEGKVWIKSRNGRYTTRNGKTLSLDHSIHEIFSIETSGEVSLPDKLLDFITIFAHKFKDYDFYYKIVPDKIYIAIDKIDDMYALKGNETTDTNSIDAIIKKDSVFFTNFISFVLDELKEELK